MSNTFRVSNLIADNIIYNTGNQIINGNLNANNLVFNSGNQIISGIKTFKDVISGNINTLYTGKHIFANEVYPDELFTWDLYTNKLKRADNGYYLNYDTYSLYSHKRAYKKLLGDVYGSVDYIFFGLDDNPFYFSNNATMMDIVANVTNIQYNTTNFTATYSVGCYKESFLIQAVRTDPNDPSITGYKINNTANTINALDPFIDLTAGKPGAGGYVSLQCAQDNSVVDGDIFIKLQPQTTVSTSTIKYYTEISVFIETYQSYFTDF